jgi:uncharacterized protein YecE (DUF72 family)
MAPKYHIGTSGWHYDHWRERFYPRDLRKPKWLEFYSRSFPTVELNNSFYQLPTEKAFATWHDSTPDGFVFAVKVNRFITHIKRLKDSEEPLQRFLDRATLLGGKLGPLLYQLPPGLHRDDERLEAFLALLPAEASHVFEFRHKSWHEQGVFDILRRHNAGFCVFDMPDLTTPLVATADFVYVRFHGSSSMYGGCYTDDELTEWARRITEAAQGTTAVYVYFNNDLEGHAVSNARSLAGKLSEKQE